jgi:hypothetical protein
MVLLGGVGPAYYLSELRYHEVATARSLPQPLLLLQGGSRLSSHGRRRPGPLAQRPQGASGRDAGAVPAR